MATATTTSEYASVLPDLRHLADQYVEKLRAEEARKRQAEEKALRELEKQERVAIARGAHEFAQGIFAQTLARVVHPKNWQGYPNGGNYGRQGQPPLAMAYLGENTWLLYTEGASHEEVMYLLQPCARCRGYDQTVLYTQQQLSALLDTGNLPVHCRACASW